jgi:hypothetical protein
MTIDPIWPCHDCLPWHLEVVVPDDDEEAYIREWHAVGCRIWDQDAP